MPEPMCFRHPDTAATGECSRCCAPVCARCTLGRTGAVLCRDCTLESRTDERSGSAVTVALVVLSLPVAAPALLLWLVARRWVRLPMFVHTIACFAGLAATVFVMRAQFGASWNLTMGVGFAGFAAGMIFFVREIVRGRA